jgi:hypothetical protein
VPTAAVTATATMKTAGAVEFTAEMLGAGRCGVLAA